MLVGKGGFIDADKIGGQNVLYGYQCYNQLNNGIKRKRAEIGLDTEGYCDSRMITDWKLDFMAKALLEHLWQERKESVLIALDLIKHYYKEERATENKSDAISIQARIDKANTCPFQNCFQNINTFCSGAIDLGKSSWLYQPGCQPSIQYTIPNAAARTWERRQNSTFPTNFFPRRIIIQRIHHSHDGGTDVIAELL